jgi:N,N'-diacetyllegionaminate synthase
MNRTIVIAEIGECFNGDMAQARKLIRVAKEADCDYAKFQTLDREGISDHDPEKEWFLKIALDQDQLKQLKQWCKEAGINFLCSPENIKKAKELKAIGCEEIKIASTCLKDNDLLSYAADNFPVVFISTGMASLEEVDLIRYRFRRQEKIYLMHCVSEYPTGPLLEKRGLRPLDHKDVNLRMMDILKQRYPGCAVGYSDHTVGILAPVLAVARGAAVIEKHITLDRKRPTELFSSGKGYLGTDHVLSLEPPELKEMVSQIRESEKILGSGSWVRSEGENILISFLQGRFSH